MPAPTLEELAPAGSDLTADPHPALAALRERGRVHRVHVPGTGDVWLVLGRDEVRAALTDQRLRNDVRHSATWESDGGHAIGLNMLQTDAPRHTRLRALVAREFTAGRVEALRPRVQRIADALLDALPPAGGFDLVAGYALPLPLTVICELLGVPAGDRHLFHTWSAELVAPSSPAAAFRHAAEPLEIAGVRIPAGDSVMLSLASASRDPAHFPDPDRFDIRRPARGHLAFGHGVHHCLGAPLARLEGRIALATLLRRLPDLTLATDPDSVERRPGAMLRGVAALPVSWSHTLPAHPPTTP
ncbi:cytochrome P450 [Streptomyces goshikiensis]